MKILFLSHEVAPFSRTGDAGDVGRALPKSLKALGHEVRVITPKYLTIRERQYGIRDVSRLQGLPVRINGETIASTVKSGFIPGSKVQVYFLENRDYFQKPPLASASIRDWRASKPKLHFFNHAALQLAITLNWIPDIIHCNDWHTAAAAIFIRDDEQYRAAFAMTRTVLQLSKGDLAALKKSGRSPAGGSRKSLPAEPKDLLGSRLISVAAAADRADLLVEVNPSRTTDLVRDLLPKRTYPSSSGRPAQRAAIKRPSEEISWNPMADAHLARRYSADTCDEGKTANKRALLKRMNLKVDPTMPVVAVAPALESLHQSELLVNAGAHMPSMPAAFIFLPTGDKKLDTLISRIAALKPDSISMAPKGQEKLKHLLVAGSDIVLMPLSCPSIGFSFADSLLYGTVPVVGCSDGGEPVDEYDSVRGRGSGFTFNLSDFHSMKEALEKALEVYKDPTAWEALRHRGVSADFRWTDSACRLIELYSTILKRKAARV